MGMEGYDAQNEGLDITYEDYEPGWDRRRGHRAHQRAHAVGAARHARARTPRGDGRRSAQAAAVDGRTRPAPRRGRVRRLGPARPLDAEARPRSRTSSTNLLDFYAGEVDQRRWYGFWNHGDVMHTYDADRHVWRYDIGGFAWDNSELSTDLWLWYAGFPRRRRRRRSAWPKR